METRKIIQSKLPETLQPRIYLIRKGRRLTPEEKQIRQNALNALALVRRKKYSLLKASKTVGLPKKLVSTVTNAFRKVDNRWKPKQYDRIPRSMVIYEKGRKRIVEITDSRNASLIGKYHSRVKQFLETGDSSHLKTLRRKQFKDSKRRIHVLETRPEKIYDIKSREAEPEFFEIYAR